MLSNQLLAREIGRGTVDSYFELTGAKDLFDEIKRALGEYTQEPNIRLFLFIAFGLNHLREWIAGCSMEEIKKKVNKEIKLNQAELFAWETIWEMPEFRVINEMCNRGKHFAPKNNRVTEVTRGFHVGGSCGDSLDQTYYMIDGVDSRRCFYAVARVYHLWFEENC